MDPITIALLIGAATLFKGSKTASKLEFFPNDIDWNKDKKRLEFVMEILNPTKNKLKIDSVYVSVFVNDRKVGSIERGEPFEIAPNKRTMVKLPLKPAGIGFAQIIADIIRGKRDFEFKVLGTVRALGLDNPINKTVALEI
jgi:LEA14-like dessication related protein